MIDQALDHREGMEVGGSAMMGFVLGAVVGAGLALLLAPAPGSDTRRRLGKTARTLGDKARRTFEQTRQTVLESNPGGPRTGSPSGSVESGRSL